LVLSSDSAEVQPSEAQPSEAMPPRSTFIYIGS
jgi:hypothetical protein